MSYSVKLHLEPVAQQRPRAVRTRGGVRMYDPDKSRKFKEEIAGLIAADMIQYKQEKITGPLKVVLNFYFKVPASYSKKRRQDIVDGVELFTKRPDVDNLAKAVLDALNGVLYVDDSQIVELSVCKHYGESAKIHLDVIEL